MTLLNLAELCVEELIRLRGNVHLIRETTQAIKSRRDACGRADRASRGRGGRKPLNPPIPWEEIHRLRRHHKTWNDIRERLEVSGYRLCRSKLIERYREWLLR